MIAMYVACHTFIKADKDLSDILQNNHRRVYIILCRYEALNKDFIEFVMISRVYGRALHSNLTGNCQSNLGTRVVCGWCFNGIMLWSVVCAYIFACEIVVECCCVDLSAPLTQLACQSFLRLNEPSCMRFEFQQPDLCPHSAAHTMQSNATWLQSWPRVFFDLL